MVRWGQGGTRDGHLRSTKVSKGQARSTKVNRVRRAVTQQGLRKGLYCSGTMGGGVGHYHSEGQQELYQSIVHSVFCSHYVHRVYIVSTE